MTQLFSLFIASGPNTVATGDEKELHDRSTRLVAEWLAEKGAEIKKVE